MRELDTALQLLVEVGAGIRRSNRLRSLRPHENQMTQRLALAFRRQKAVTLRYIRGLEDVPPDRWEWDRIWANVTVETREEFAQALRWGVGKGLLTGATAGSRRLGTHRSGGAGSGLGHLIQSEQSLGHSVSYGARITPHLWHR